MSTPPNSRPHLARRILGSPPARLLWLGFILILMMTLNTDGMTRYAGEPFKAVLHIMALAVAGFAVYIGYAHFIEQRAASELAAAGMARQRGLGLLFGAVEQRLGSWAALVVTSLVFGLSHLMNPEGTLEGALFIAVEAGILLAGAYMLTRRLWLSIGFHMAWNCTQSAIFSGIVAGNVAQQGLIRSTTNGPDWPSGGNFGVESSVPALVLCTSTGIVMLVMAVKRGQVVPPIWKRKG